MSIGNVTEAANRLAGDGAALTEDEIRQMMLYVRYIAGGNLRRLYVELALQNLAAIRRFDVSSAKLSKRLLFLTYVLVGLTIVMTVATILTAIPILSCWMR